MGKRLTISALLLGTCGCLLLDQKPAGVYPESLLPRVLASAEINQAYICESPCGMPLRLRLEREFQEHHLSVKGEEEQRGAVRLDVFGPLAPEDRLTTTLAQKTGPVFFLRLQPVGPDGTSEQPPTHTRITVVWYKTEDRAPGFEALNNLFHWKAKPNVEQTNQGTNGSADKKNPK